jgi:uncharacterized protein (TIGR02145 family)
MKKILRSTITMLFISVNFICFGSQEDYTYSYKPINRDKISLNDSVQARIIDVKNIQSTSSSVVCAYKFNIPEGQYLKEMGVCYGMDASPNILNNKVVFDSYEHERDDLGNYSFVLKRLFPGTSYFVRAYVVIGSEVYYGNELSFYTAFQGVIFDGYRYPSITTENGQEWFTENLRSSLFSNGDSIPNMQDSLGWASTNTAAWCHYNNDTLFESTYGKLYNWYAVNDDRNICPTGWHVSTSKDVERLIQSLSDSYLGGGSYSGNYIGSIMKSKTQWKDFMLGNKNVGNGNNLFGFNGYPGGGRNQLGQFDHINYYGYWWISSLINEVSSEMIILNYNNEHLKFNSLNNHFGLSVRCVKD